MTDKRFKVVNLRDDNVCDIQDTSQEFLTFYNDLTYNFGSAKAICDLLNELHEENQDLKAFNQDLSEELSVCANARISKDNRIERLEEKIQIERTSFTKTQGRWSKEAETKIKELSEENEQLKKALLFFYDVANCECSTNWKGDMEKGCKRFFNCTYEEAEEKYGDYDGMWWELE